MICSSFLSVFMVCSSATSTIEDVVLHRELFVRIRSCQNLKPQHHHDIHHKTPSTAAVLVFDFSRHAHKIDFDTTVFQRTSRSAVFDREEGTLLVDAILLDDVYSSAIVSVLISEPARRLSIPCGFQRIQHSWSGHDHIKKWSCSPFSSDHSLSQPSQAADDFKFKPLIRACVLTPIIQHTTTSPFNDDFIRDRKALHLQRDGDLEALISVVLRH
ncbi:hypothetical protein MRB53_038862 [Persea americana]|nr:hypothetical protein MRB53_038862 [Persea americana]